MIQTINNKTYLINNAHLLDSEEEVKVAELNQKLSLEGNGKVSEADFQGEKAKKNTLAYQIFKAHNISDNMEDLNIKFDAMTSHDITYVGIVQTARASGLKKFPIPYVLTNCHNSLCAVGGTINEDDHMFGLSAAKKYGGIYVPAHLAVIHQYMRETMAGCGKMILGSDSHTRYGALGTMAVGEGGPELVKQLLEKTYDIEYPEVVAVYLENEPPPYVGPQDVALSIVAKVFSSGFVKNKVMEFVGPGINNLSVDIRNGIDVMTTETTCLSSIWCTDKKVEDFLELHGRKSDYKELIPGKVACYDAVVKVDLSKIEPVIALPFHPSNVYTIEELKNNPYEILKKVEEDAKGLFSNTNIDFKLTDKIKDGNIVVDQGVVGGCAGGTYENMLAVGKILAGRDIGCEEFSLNIYPSSQPEYYELNKQGVINNLLEAGASVKTAICGPCFGSGDVPANRALSIRHNTRNFPNREGSIPKDGQISSVALMDARSIAATAINRGVLTSAKEVQNLIPKEIIQRDFNDKIYKKRVYWGFGNPQSDVELTLGPNIKDWPKMIEMTDNLLLRVASSINDPVTSTDELIPSGETSSYRSDPYKLAEFTLSRKDPNYVGRAKEVNEVEKERIETLKNSKISKRLEEIYSILGGNEKVEELYKTTSLGSVITARKIGDGSAREQAASCQKVLGGWANIAKEYATKRYRSNCINWGLVPFIIKEDSLQIDADNYVFIPGIKKALEGNEAEIKAYIIGEEETKEVVLYLENLSKNDRKILLAGCLINYYKKNK